MNRSRPIVFHSARRLGSAELFRVYQRLRERFGHQRWWPGETPFEVAVGAILTQNTAWTNVEKAITNLKRERLLRPRALDRISLRRLEKALKPSGYFRVKAVRLKHFVGFLLRRYGGSMERMRREPVLKLREALLGVNGIGRETADSILLYACGKPIFVIDAYTRRIFGRHRLLPADSDYDGWRRCFERALPKRGSLYNDYHAQIVRLGKEFCRPRPLCQGCPLKPYL